MKYTNFYIEDHRMIQSAYYNKSLVLFVGAGACKSAGMPLWSEAVKRFADGLDINVDDWDQLKIPQLYYNERGSKEYIQTAREVFRYGDPIKPTLLDKKIAEIEPQRVITTNYDHLIEDVMIDEGLYYQVLSSDQDIPFHDSHREIIKMHGDFEHDNFVLKEDDYLTYSENFRMIETYVKAVIARSVVVFVGYGLNDPDVKQTLTWVKTVTQPHYQRAYFIETGKTFNQYMVDYYRNLGVNIIFPDKMFDDKNFEYDVHKQEQYACDMLDYLVFGADKDGLDSLYYDLYYPNQLNSLMNQQLIKCLHKVGLDNDADTLVCVDRYKGNKDAARELLIKIAAEAVIRNENQALVESCASSGNVLAKMIHEAITKLTKDEKSKLDLVLDVLWKTGITCIYTSDALDSHAAGSENTSTENTEESSFDINNIAVPGYHDDFYDIAKSIEDASINFDLQELRAITSELSADKKLSPGKRDLLTAYCKFALKDYDAACRFLEYASIELYQEKEYLWYLITQMNRKWAGPFVKNSYSVPRDAAKKIGEASEKIDPKEILNRLPMDRLAIKGATDIFDDIAGCQFCNDARIQLDYLSGKVNEELRKFFFLGPTNPAIYQMRDIANSLRSFVMCNAMFLDAYVEVLDQYKCFVDLLLRSFSARDLFDKDFDSDASNFREKKAHKIDLYFMLKSFTSTQFGIELTTYHLNDIELYDDGLEYVKKVVPIILGRNLYDNAVAMCYEMIPHLAIDGDIAKYILEIIQKTIRKGLIPSICLKISDFIYRNFTPENDSDAHEENDLRDNTYFTKDGGYIHFFEKVVEASVPDCSDNVNIQTMLGELAYQWPARYLRCESSYISKIIRQPSNIKLAIAISKCLIDEDLQSVKNHLQRLLPMNDIQLYSKAILRDLIEPEEESEKSFIEELKSRVNKEIENRNKPFRSFPSPYEDYFSKLITLVLNNKTKTITVDTLKANLLEDNAKGRFLIAVADESDNKADFESVEPDWLKNYSPALLKHIAQNDAASTVIREKFREYSEQNGSRVDIELYKIFFKWFAVPVKKEQKAEELS